MGTLNRAFCAWNWYKRVISGFRVWKVPNSSWPPTPTSQNNPHLWKSCECISYYLALIPLCIYATISIIKNLQHNFPKMRGGVKGRLEFFQKFIRFGSGTPPLSEILCKWIVYFIFWKFIFSFQRAYKWFNSKFNSKQNPKYSFKKIFIQNKIQNIHSKKYSFNRVQNIQ